MYPQRRPPALRGRPAGSRPWLLTEAELRDARAGGDPRYVVVDDLEDDVAVLVVAPWPEQDAAGRLTFGGPDRRRMWSVNAGRLHRRVVAARREAGEPAADRPLRIGDAFFATVTADPESEESLSAIRDVSREAREQAKLAHFAAVTPRVDPAYAAEMARPDSDADEEPPPAGPGPTASPVV